MRFGDGNAGLGDGNTDYYEDPCANWATTYGKGIIQSIFAFSKKAQKTFFWIILSQIKKVFFPVFSYR